LAAASRLVKRLSIPILDFIVLWSGFQILFPYWEKFRYEPGYYPETLLIYAIPLYIVAWLMVMYYTGGYEKPVSLLKIFRGVAWGTFFILVVYSLLPESARFSRAIILLGALLSTILIVFVRLSLHFLIGKSFLLSDQPAKRVAIIGLKEECDRVHEMLVQSGVQFDLAGYIAPCAETYNEAYIGPIEQTAEIARVNQLDELIFCSENVASQLVIKTMLALTPYKLEYKIAPPSSVSIIGSNSIDTAGDLYVVNDNAISNEKNRRSKRLLDLLASLFFILTMPFLIWFVEKQLGFARNCFKVLFRKKSWVGYHPVSSEIFLGLPALRPGVLKCTQLIAITGSEPAIADHWNMHYARDYKISYDLEIMWKSFRKLGQ
jgi:O-antigen biosynthesis protein